jgi:hypothetical protein
MLLLRKLLMDMVVRTYNPSGGTQAGSMKVPCQPDPHSKNLSQKFQKVENK